MATDDGTSRIELSRDELRFMATVISLRLQLRLPEAQRTARVRELIAASSDLADALSGHSQRAAVACENTRAAVDATAENDRLFESLQRFTTLVHAIAADFSAFADIVAHPGVEAAYTLPTRASSPASIATVTSAP